MDKKNEKASLLGGNSITEGGYGGDNALGGCSNIADATGSVTEADTRKIAKPSGKRDRLQRSSSLDKLDEDEEKRKSKEYPGKPKHACPNFSFGVRSYLHNFYDAHFYKDPDVYEEDPDDLRYLLHPNPRKRRCTSIWWKVFVWIGANFLIFGIIGVLVGYLVPQKPIIVGSIAENIEIIDREAISFNFNLDVCKLVGLILFCIGGLTLTVALLFPSLLHQYCEEERRDSSFWVSANLEQEKEPLRSPLEMTIPYNSQVTSVQPGRKEESLVAQEGLVSINE